MRTKRSDYGRFDAAGIIPPPTPWDAYAPGLFRLAGFGGVAVFLRSGVVGGGQPNLVLDIGFLTPEDYVWFLRQPMTAGLSEHLAQFFFACAGDQSPELSVASVVDPLSGLDVRVLSGDATQVELQIEVEDEGVNFLTTRVALAQAADDVRVLESAIVEDDPTLMDW